MVFVILSFLPCRRREYIGHPREWADFLKGLNDYHAYGGQLSEEEVTIRVARDWAAELHERYVNASEINFNFNIKKMGYQGALNGVLAEPCC